MRRQENERGYHLLVLIVHLRSHNTHITQWEYTHTHAHTRTHNHTIIQPHTHKKDTYPHTITHSHNRHLPSPPHRPLSLALSSHLLRHRRHLVLRGHATHEERDALFQRARIRLAVVAREVGAEVCSGRWGRRRRRPAAGEGVGVDVVRSAAGFLRAARARDCAVAARHGNGLGRERVAAEALEEERGTRRGQGERGYT